MGEITNIAKLLLLMEAEIADLSKDTPEAALWCLLTEYKQNLPELDCYFMKAFRQWDVTPSGKVDMAIWHLLKDAPIFWSCFAKVTIVDGGSDE